MDTGGSTAPDAVLVRGREHVTGVLLERVVRQDRRPPVPDGGQVPAAPVKPTPGDWSDNKLTIAWLGHATVLRDETAAGINVYLAGIWLDNDVRNPRVRLRIIES